MKFSTWLKQKIFGEVVKAPKGETFVSTYQDNGYSVAVLSNGEEIKRKCSSIKFSNSEVTFK